MLIDQGVLQGYARAIVGANKRIVYAKNLVCVHSAASVVFFIGSKISKN